MNFLYCVLEAKPGKGTDLQWFFQENPIFQQLNCGWEQNGLNSSVIMIFLSFFSL